MYIESRSLPFAASCDSVDLRWGRLALLGQSATYGTCSVYIPQSDASGVMSQTPHDDTPQNLTTLARDHDPMRWLWAPGLNTGARPPAAELSPHRQLLRIFRGTSPVQRAQDGASSFVGTLGDPILLRGLGISNWRLRIWQLKCHPKDSFLEFLPKRGEPQYRPRSCRIRRLRHTNSRTPNPREQSPASASVWARGMSRPWFQCCGLTQARL